MMAYDYISYRIPGQKIVRKKGMFQRIEKGQSPKGFVLTNFEGDLVYQFGEEHDGSFAEWEKPFVATNLDYLKNAEVFIDYLKVNGGKAVLSRIKDVVGPEDRWEYFLALCEAYPNAFVYTFTSANLGSWVGATPEILLASKDRVGKTMALAGTRRSDDEIVWTEKEFEEHELVADYIENNLEEADLEGIIRSERKEKVSGPVRHLLTDFTFDLPIEKEWELAQKLHPTPAVSGWPVESALQLIRSNEKHDRRFYTGIIGVIGDETNLYVNLRCAEYGDTKKMYLYLGGGFTKDSDPEAEWEETENKAATLINVLKNG